MNHESSYSPPRGCAQQKKKENPGATSAVGGMAPALEHGHQSNAKENDRAGSNSFDPHMCALLQGSVALTARMQKGAAHLDM
jgi:hypothetical protein